MAEATDGSVPAGAQRGAAGQARTTAGLWQGGRGRDADKVGGVHSLRVRLGCFTNLHRQSTRNLVPRIMWTLELQRWPHTSDTCVMADGCVMAALLHA
jgi:hypothetical protein